MNPAFFVVPCVLSPSDYQDVRNAHYEAFLPHPPSTRTFPRAVERRAYWAYKQWDTARRRLKDQLWEFGASHGHLYELSRAELVALKDIVSRLVFTQFHHCAGRARFLRNYPWAFGSLKRRQEHKDLVEAHVAELET
ncbi:hypothetical protein BFJ72_g337 [Fusarium proliferatum]|uniref:Uncharacterized protein n=1 Tax=Gibberella intermedia TaxID=948311 RepID=A0A420UAV8_GIBIN|nr:hypothetical protein BFJ72_g337 [Fusarium proliferatum]